MIEAFFDDSGKQADSPFVCIAGFLAHCSYWYRFVEQWNPLLQRYGITNLHMKELMSSNGEFKEFSPEQRNKLIVEVMQIIKANELCGFGAAVDAKYWNTLPKEIKKKYGNAEEFCFQRILRMMRDYMVSCNETDHVSITFDHDQEFSNPRLTRFNNITKRDPLARERFISICFARTRPYPPLQAADVLAWETRKMLESRYEGKEKSFGSAIIFETPGLQFVGEYWNKDEFEKRTDFQTGELKQIDDPISN
jgi:hypothetical protein